MGRDILQHAKIYLPRPRSLLHAGPFLYDMGLPQNLTTPAILGVFYPLWLWCASSPQFRIAHQASRLRCVEDAEWRL